MVSCDTQDKNERAVGFYAQVFVLRKHSRGHKFGIVDEIDRVELSGNVQRLYRGRFQKVQDTMNCEIRCDERAGGR